MYVCMYVCFAMHAQTAAPIRTKLGTSVPSVSGMVIGRSNFGSGCPKTREDQKKQKKTASKTKLGISSKSEIENPQVKGWGCHVFKLSADPK